MAAHNYSFYKAGHKYGTKCFLGLWAAFHLNSKDKKKYIKNSTAIFKDNQLNGVSKNTHKKTGPTNCYQLNDNTKK